MARRASSGVNTQALLIGAAILALLIGGGYWFLNRTPSGFDAPQLDVEQARENGKSLAGNRFQVSGTLIDRRIEANGQIVIIQIGESSNAKQLAIKIPPGFQGGNLNLQTDYRFLVEFGINGLAIAEAVQQL